MIHSFLLIGQSNMAGRGFVNEVKPISNEKIKVLRNGRWQQMYVPVNCDRSFAGINLAESFADLYAKEKNVDVGLIPCADGGTSLEQWREGGLLFDNAIYQARLAMRTSTIAGVLWHQGESDCDEKLFPLYEEKLTRIIDALRKELDLYDVPFLLGGLGEYLKNCLLDERLKNYTYINDSLKKIAKKEKMIGFVESDGLKANPDNLHFCAKALREFGKRYYNVFCGLEDKNKMFAEKSEQDSAIRTAMELL